MWNQFGDSLIPDYSGTNDPENDGETPDGSDAPDSSADDPSSAIPDDAEIEGESFTVLFLGEDPKGASLDCIVLMRVNKSQRKVLITSLNPSGQLYIGHGAKDYLAPLGKLYQYKSMSFLLEKVQAITGLKVDYYVFFTFDSFLGAFETLYPNGYKYSVPIAMDYTDEEQGLTIRFDKDQSISKAEDILKMLRYKEDGLNNRMSRQRDFAASILKSTLSSMVSLESGARAVTAFSNLLKQVETNLTADFFRDNLALIAYLPSFEFKLLPESSSEQYILYR